MLVKVTKQSLADQAHRRWCEQYADDPERLKNEGDRLKALGIHPDPDDVNKIIGNNSWTICYCEECGQSVDVAVIIGQEPDWDSNTATVCESCLAKALELIRSKEQP